MNIILISIYEIPPREWLPCTTIICNHSERTIHETISSLKEGAFYFLLHRYGASQAARDGTNECLAQAVSPHTKRN